MTAARSVRRRVALAMLAFLFACSWAWGAGAEPAQTRYRAAQLAGEAIDLFEAGDYQAALEKFQRANELLPAPTLELRIARSLDRLDRMLEAAEVYRQVIGTELKPWDKPAFHRARKDAVPELAALLAQVPSVTVVVRGEGAGEAEVFLEGELLPPEVVGEEQSVDPGHYLFEARVEDRRVREDVDLERGDKARVRLTLPPLERPPEPATEPRSAPEPVADTAWLLGGWTALGVGGAAAIVGAITGGLVLERRGGLEERCPARQCAPADHDDARSFNRLRAATTGMFVVAGGGLATGTLLLLLTPDEEPRTEAQLRPVLGLGMLGVTGRF